MVNVFGDELMILAALLWLMNNLYNDDLFQAGAWVGVFLYALGKLINSVTSLP